MTKTQIQEIHNTLLDIMASGLIEENEEVRKVAMKAARRLVCENQPITFGAVVSVNAKYALKSNSPEEGMSAIPNLIEDINDLNRF